MPRRRKFAQAKKQISKTLRFLDGRIDSERRIYAVIAVINCQNLLAIQSNVDKGHIS
jgi:hypothetical protein